MSRGKGIVLSYVYTALSVIIGLFMSSFIVRVVGQAHFGVYQAITAFTSYLVLFELGTSNIISRNISLLKKDGSDQCEINKNISTVWTITLLLSVMIVFVAIICYSFIDNVYKNSMTFSQIAMGKRMYVFAVVKLIFGFYTQTLTGALIGFEQYSFPKVVAILQLFLRTSLVVILLLQNGDILSVVIVDALLEIVAFLCMAMFCKVNIRIELTTKYFDKAIFVSALPLAVALLFQSVINMANNSIDKFIISIAMKPENVAVYSVAMFIYTTFSSVVSIPISMYMPEVAKNIKEGLTGTSLTDTLVQPCRLVVLIGGAIVGGFWAVGRPFINLVYGADYDEAWIISMIIMLPMLINMTNGVIINVLDVLNKRIVRSSILLGVAIINVGLTIWWVNIWGMRGAATATAVSAIFGLILSNTYYSKKIGIKIVRLFCNSYRGILPCLAIASIIGHIIARYFVNQLFGFFFGGIMFVAIFIVAFCFFGVNKSEKAIINNYINKKT